MKKAYLYFLIPLLGLIGFGAVYWNFSANYSKVEADKAAAILKIKNDKLTEENRLREKAINDANIAQQKKKEERAIKEAKDRKDREDRENAIQARSKAAADADRLKKQVDRLAKEMAVVKEDISKIEEDKKRIADEQVFLTEFVKKVESNAKSLTVVLERIEAADAAAEAAAIAAAKAAAELKNKK